MATKKQEAIEYFSIEEMKDRLSISSGIHAGICTMCGWSTGKQVTEVEYKGAIDKFVNKSVDGK